MEGVYRENFQAMAEIKIQKKKSGNTGLWILLILVLIVATVLILDATEVISSPNWIHSEAEVIDPADIDTTY